MGMHFTQANDNLLCSVAVWPLNTSWILVQFKIIERLASTYLLVVLSDYIAWIKLSIALMLCSYFLPNFYPSVLQPLSACFSSLCIYGWKAGLAQVALWICEFMVYLQAFLNALVTWKLSSSEHSKVWFVTSFEICYLVALELK